MLQGGRDLALWQKHAQDQEQEQPEEEELPPPLQAARELVARLKARAAYLAHVREEEEKAYQL